MKALLMHPDRDFNPEENPIANSDDVIQDLELAILFRAMAAGDEFLGVVAKGALLQGLSEPASILYRQSILKDCIEQPDVVRQIYGIAAEAIEREKGVWGWMSNRYPEGALHRSIEVLGIFIELLKKLRSIADAHGEDFRSEGLRRFFTMLQQELSDEYLQSVEDHLERLKFRDGMLMSARLGQGNKGANYILRKPPFITKTWIERLQGWVNLRTGGDRDAYVYEVDERDEAGYNALSELRTRGVAHIAGALAQSTEHILGFFRMLRSEMCFYVCCLNLRNELVQRRAQWCFPSPTPAGESTLAAQGLYDLCLQLESGGIVANDFNANGRLLIVITGANRGGKSTFLRSVGIAQLMMQSGMFVAAQSFEADICTGLFTHFKREEDATMTSGKLDEELNRMSGIVDRVTPHGVVLFNESFASTNEREGSEIARQIVQALLEMRIRVVYVTHMFDLAQRFHERGGSDSLFLRAERLPDGQRTFRIVEGEPLPTSFGEDLYRRIFPSTPEDTQASTRLPA